MDFLDKRIEDYSQIFSDREPSLLKEIHDYTLQNVPQPRMLSGHLQGRFLSMISKIKRPKKILEIGTYTGYSALCMAEGLDEKGKLITIDRDKSLYDKVSEFFNRSEYKNQIIQRLGNAIDILSEFDEKFDLVFIDADKENYIKYFQLVSEKLNPNGLIISDNVLWSGKVVEGENDDEETNTIKKFNRILNDDKKFETVILPLRDGISISRLV